VTETLKRTLPYLKDVIQVKAKRKNNRFGNFRNLNIPFPILTQNPHNLPQDFKDVRLQEPYKTISIH
jgi:hypothetical protein